MILQDVNSSIFTKIVRNHENICRIGKQIIDHKDFIRKIAPNKLDEEFRKQEERIQEFVKITNKAHEEWDKNEYWTGWS